MSSAGFSVVLRQPFYDDIHRLNRKLLLLRLQRNTRWLMCEYRLIGEVA